MVESSTDDSIVVDWSGDAADFDTLRTATAVYRVLDFAVSRPRALLGDQHQRRLNSALAAISVSGKFHGLRLRAAGAHTDTMRRIAEASATAAGVPIDDEGGDLAMRVLPAAGGWRVLIRLHPRPLSVRPWRVVDYHGAVNAAIAAAMVRLTRINDSDRVLNVMCGSSTIAIEAVLAHPNLGAIIAVDDDPMALEASLSNAAAAAVERRLDLRLGTATGLDLDENSIEVAFADPPWTGQTREQLSGLYRESLTELSRVLQSGGRVAWLSHQVELSRQIIPAMAAFEVCERLTVTQGGLHPSLWILARR